MNHILTSRRLSLTSSHVDDIMRVRLNSLEKIANFNAHKYAAGWVKDHKRSDDPISIKKPRKTTLMDESEEDRVFLPQWTLGGAN